MRTLSLLIISLLEVAGAAISAVAADFETDIRPILRQRCISCHGAVKQEGGLRLDAGILIRQAADGSVVVPGHSESSDLIRRITTSSPDEKMPPEGARLSEPQIQLLREWIDAGAEVPADEPIPQSPSEHWSFQAVRRPAVPKMTDQSWGKNEIDAFILARLTADGRKPEPQASPQVLLRRVFLDLIGMPPTIEEQEQFSKSPNLQIVVEDLLSRPEYGERWARHWLDVVRYADTNGYERDAEKPAVWRYRDYVIQALIDDKPFDRFVLEQIAGDELPDRSVQTQIATGFLRLGHWDDEPADPETDRYDQLDDIVSTTGQAFLGLTIGCARCHDHKFEPLEARDYYSLVSVFEPLERPRDGRTEKTIAVDGTDIYAWQERSGEVPESHVLVRGSPARKGERVTPAVPAILVKQQPTFPEPGPAATHRRLGLARWIASPDNPLTARVIVNRVWQHHFGQGLVPTANDFGLMGSPPTDPELLNWLAHWFMHDAGWSLKKLHALILNSQTWQTVKSPDSVIRYRRLEVEAIRDSMLVVSGQLNPSHFGPPMRPVIPLAAIEANTDKDKVWQASDERDASRRSIYALIKRGLVIPMFESLDLADSVSSCPQRQVTTVAPQALSLFNGDLTQRQARAFAERLRQEAGTSPDEQVTLAWRLALCRNPAPGELEHMRHFLQEESLEQLCRVILNLNEFVYTE